MAGITDEQRDLAVSMARTGKGRNEIARVVGISAGSVTNVIRAAGLSFDPGKTELATKTRKVELAERRSKLELDLLEDAAKLRRLVWQPREYAQAVGGESAGVIRWELDTPLPADQLKLMQAATLGVQQSQKIADATADNGAEQAKSMLAGLFEALTDAHHQQTNQETP